MSPAAMKLAIVERFVSRWRSQVGNDFYPAIRLICPDKDRERPMYGIKEKNLAKLLVKLMKINPNSEDGSNLINWKLPGKSANRMAGDFAGIAYGIVSKRSMRSDVGSLTMAQVNEMLDRLAGAQKEEAQLLIFQEFYQNMNASELMWLIRIILRQMKVGATEHTFLNVWHPDGMALFNVTSSLRKVCWDLQDPNIRLEGDTGAKIGLMSCFQPQLAQYQAHSFKIMVDKMLATNADDTMNFWIEEKLDGERMQMHLRIDEDGDSEFAFWSRKAKDYTYLYGASFDDNNASLTRFIKDAFHKNLRNIILDGEMVTWDPERGAMVAFGTLKTAALGQSRNIHDDKGIRPLFRVFDCVYLNDRDLTDQPLKLRYHALKQALQDVPGRIEKLQHIEADSIAVIEPALRKVIEEQAEGLVLKNPLSVYEISSRNNNWMKVKPEYMTEFGESLDCLIIGGYYGQGHRGGALASFLCGLRVDQNDIRSHGKHSISVEASNLILDAGADSMKFHSFCKVGGGFRAEDLANIKHHTDGKWKDWDPKHPPTQYIELAGPNSQAERPDQWILPSDSVVVEVKAASVGDSQSFRTGFTLRFPRFKKLRMDKNWETALSRDEFLLLKSRAEVEAKEKQMTVDNSRKRISKRLKKEVVIAGNDSKVKTPYAGPQTKIFEGLNFCVLTEMTKLVKKNKAELEQIIKSNGGTITQNPRLENVFCIGEKRNLKIVSLIKADNISVIKPIWILDAIKQAEEDGPGKERYLIPLEPTHMFHMRPDMQEEIEGHVDVYGDSYTRDVTGKELKRILDEMVHPKGTFFSPNAYLVELEKHGEGIGEMPGSLFQGCKAWFAPVNQAKPPDNQEHLEHRIQHARFSFAGGRIAESEEDEDVTHFVAVDDSSESARKLGAIIAGLGRRKIPRVVKWTWLRDCWVEKTLLDEERYALAT
jgi:DNA ligase-4